MQSRQLNVLLTGEEAVGKSTILQLLTGCPVLASESYEPTVGIDFKIYTVRSGTGEEHRIAIWDTAGQERFKFITALYYEPIKQGRYHGPQLLLHVVNLSKPFHQQKEEFKRRFLEDIRNRTTCPRVLVGMKEDLRTGQSDDKLIITNAQLKILADDYFGGNCYICSKATIQVLDIHDDRNPLGKLIVEEAKRQMPRSPARVQQRRGGERWDYEPDESIFSSASCFSFFKGVKYTAVGGIGGAVVGGTLYKVGELSGLFLLPCSLSSAVFIGAAAGAVLLLLILMLRSALCEVDATTSLSRG